MTLMKRTTAISWLAFGFAAQFLTFSDASAIEWIDNSSFPIKNSEAQATAFSKVFQPKSNNFGYSNVSLPSGKSAEYAYGYQYGGSADLVVMVPGVGGSFRSDMNLRLGEILRDRHGFHFISIDSLFSRNFAEKASPKPIVGVTRFDAEAMYQMLTLMLADFRSRTGARIRRVHLIGYSLGALSAAHLREVDTRLKIINFKKTILANPPINFKYSIAVVDNLFLASKDSPRSGMNEFLGYPYNVFEQRQRELGIPISPVDKLIYDVIGNTFHGDLEAVIRVAKNDATTRPYVVVSTGATFSDYVNKVVFPFCNDNHSEGSSLTGPDWFRYADIRSLGAMMRDDSNIYMMHAQGDFLIKEDDWQWMDETFGQRARVFRYGGHLGYFLTAEGLDAILKILD